VVFSWLSSSSAAARSACAFLLGTALLAALVATGGATAAGSAPVKGGPHGTAISLVSQTNWVTGGSMLLEVTIRSTVRQADLGLKLTVYSRLTSRYAFDLSESGRLAPNELVLDSTPIIPLDTLLVTGTSTFAVALHVRVTTKASPTPGPLGSPELALDCAPLACDGVYPLEVTVADTSNNLPLTSFTTYLVYVAGEPGSIPLRVAIVLPFGATPALDASGASALTAGDLRSLAATLKAIRDDPDDRLTLAVYPQLLTALAETRSSEAASVLANMRALAKRQRSSAAIEFLEVPFTPVNLDTLNSAGLGGELQSQLSAAARVFQTTLSATPPRGPYLSTTPLDDAGLADLATQHIARVIIPPTGLPVTELMTRSSPFSLKPSATKKSGALAARPSALVADSILAAHFAAKADPVLAAHHFLAEIAQIYFEEPFGPQARGVVVAPETIPGSSVFLRAVLAGLESSPVARQATVASIFSAVPVGADGATRQVVAVTNHASTPYLFASSIQAAHSTLQAIASIVPDDAAFLSTVGDSILLAETAGLDHAAWTRYADEPLGALAQIERAISVSGARTVTLTQRTAKVPITIVSAFPSPIHATLQLTSSTLVITPADLSRAVVLGHKNSPFQIPVTTRTSGVSTLEVELVSPRGGVVLFAYVVTVRSTAFSSVAVALSVVAVLVLALWWFRARARRRRRATELAASESSPANLE
jgi:hypothetical protein